MKAFKILTLLGLFVVAACGNQNGTNGLVAGTTAPINNGFNNGIYGNNGCFNQFGNGLYNQGFYNQGYGLYPNYYNQQPWGWGTYGGYRNPYYGNFGGINSGFGCPGFYGYWDQPSSTWIFKDASGNVVYQNANVQNYTAYPNFLVLQTGGHVLVLDKSGKTIVKRNDINGVSSVFAYNGKIAYSTTSGARYVRSRYRWKTVSASSWNSWMGGFYTYWNFSQ